MDEKRIDKTFSLNQAGKFVSPDGKIMDRESVLRSLNLDPNTPPDAWLCIGCVNNRGTLRNK